MKSKSCFLVIASALLLFALSAHADSTPTEYSITGQTDFAACAAVEIGVNGSGCNAVTFALDATTLYDTSQNAIGPVLDIESLSGFANGVAVTGSGGYLLISANYLPFSPIPITIGGVPGDISFYFADNFVTFDGALVDWNVVQTPEPSAFLLLVLAIPLLLKYRNLNPTTNSIV
jgi:hypothetical protein